MPLGTIEHVNQSYDLTFTILRLTFLSLLLYTLPIPLSFSLCPASFTDGCPNLCNGNGQCTMGQNSWHCECKTGWRGNGCSVAMETSCADNKDNEGGQTNKAEYLTFTIAKYKKDKQCLQLYNFSSI